MADRRTQEQYDDAIRTLECLWDSDRRLRACVEELERENTRLRDFYKGRTFIWDDALDQAARECWPTRTAKQNAAAILALKTTKPQGT